jgi:ABC-type sugar transport system substrate-binding protein
MQENQLKAVRSFIAQRVDAIIIAPLVVSGWDQVLKEAKAANIPVFLADRDVDTQDKSLFVTRMSADFNLEGPPPDATHGGSQDRLGLASATVSRHRRRGAAKFVRG